MGVKHSTTESNWDVKKDGTHGWKYFKKTRYKCQFEGVPASNRSNSELVSEERTKSSQRAGNNSILCGTTSGISGVGITRPGGMKSESENGLSGRNTE